MSLDRYSGKVLWSISLEGPLWGSPVVVEDILLIGDCGGHLRAYGVERQMWNPSRFTSRNRWLPRGNADGLGGPNLYRFKKADYSRWASDRCCVLESRHDMEVRCFTSRGYRLCRSS